MFMEVGRMKHGPRIKPVICKFTFNNNCLVDTVSGSERMLHYIKSITWVRSLHPLLKNDVEPVLSGSSIIVSIIPSPLLHPSILHMVAIQLIPNSSLFIVEVMALTSKLLLSDFC